MLGIISIVLLLVVYQVVVYGMNLWIDAGIGIVSFYLGLFVFSKMNKVTWDEETEIVSVGRMDAAGFLIILLYIAFEISLRSILKLEYAGTLAATSYLLAGIGASLLGRTIGTLIAIQKVVQKEDIQM